MNYFEISVIDEWHKTLYVDNFSLINTRTAAEEAIRELIVLLIRAKQENYKISIVGKNKVVSPSDSVVEMLTELEEKSRGKYSNAKLNFKKIKESKSVRENGREY